MKEKTADEKGLTIEYIEYYRKLNKYCVIANCIKIICFTILAIIFKKWWVILFSCLFTTSIERKKEDE